jgi:hypothetical protein
MEGDLWGGGGGVLTGWTILGLMMTYLTKGRTQKLAQKFKIVKTYWHDHSLESSWKALSDGTISFSIQVLGK